MKTRMPFIVALLVLCRVLAASPARGDTAVVNGFTFEVGADGLYYTTYQFYSGSDVAKDIVVLGDGYTATEAADFLAIAGEVIDELWKVDPYDEARCAFNVWFVHPISSVSGISSGTPLATSLSGSGYGFITANANNIGNACDAAGVPGRDIFVVIANEQSKYGAWAQGNLICMTSGFAMGALLAHEIGHVLGKLGDEYDFYYGNSLDNTRYYTGGETGYPNVSIYGKTDVVASIPWTDLIEQWVIDNKFLPTDDMSSCVCGTIGAWEGAGTYRNLYRPAEYCLMRRVCDSTPFCTVCRNELAAILGTASAAVEWSCFARRFDLDRFLDFMAMMQKASRHFVPPTRREPIPLPGNAPVLVVYEVPPCIPCLPLPVPAGEPSFGEPIRVTVRGVEGFGVALAVFDDRGALVAGPVQPAAGVLEVEFTGNAGRQYRAMVTMQSATKRGVRLETEIYRNGVSVLE